MTSPAHPSLRTFPRLQLLFSATYHLFLSLSPVNCASILIRQLPSFYPNSLTLLALSVFLSLSLGYLQFSTLLTTTLSFSLLHNCSFPSLRLAIGGRVFPSSHSNFPPSIHPCCFSVIPLLLSLTNPSFAFCLCCCCFFFFLFCSLSLSLSLSFFLSFSFLLSRCCCFIIVGAPSSCILST